MKKALVNENIEMKKSSIVHGQVDAKNSDQFTFSSKELVKWAKAGLLNKEDVDLFLRDDEIHERRRKAMVEFNEQCQKEGRNPSQEEWNTFLAQFPESSEDWKKKVEVLRYIVENKDKLLIVLQPPKISKFRQSGHVIDQKLQPDRLPERTLFDLLSPESQGKVEEYEIKTTGIHLTPTEDKMVTALLLLLHKKSEHHNENSPNFYKGNESSLPVVYGGKESNMAVIRCSIAEVCKAYLGKEDYSGSELEHVKSTLFETEKKKFLIMYDRKRTKGDKKLTDRIEDVRSLYKIIKYYEGLTEEELAALDNGDEKLKDIRGELIIGFCPILTDQIDKKYVEYPEDINRRMVVAAGGFKKVTSSDNQLRDYLLRELSAKRYEFSINEEKLIPILGLSTYEKDGRKKRIQQRIQASVQTCKNLGLLIDHERTVGAFGQWKHGFTINKNFE